MKSHVLLLRRVLREAGNRCCTCTSKDFKTILTRIEHEGFSFLTITLPQFAKDFERSLELAVIGPNLFQSFRKRSCLPAFLQGFTSQVFDMNSGVLLDTPSIDAIHSIRQIGYLFSKVELPCTDVRVSRAFAQYVKTDQELASLNVPSELRDEFKRVAFKIWWPILHEMDLSIYRGEIVPKHGPGATAQKISGNQKYVCKLWTSRLERVFPHGEFLFSSWRHYDASRVTILEPDAEIPVRVVSVPKTLKTPRIIAIEPVHMQYVQQGLWRRLRTLIERDDILSMMVGFSDQEPNRSMAKEGSLYGNLATLDLSEASDRVSNWLVKDLMFRNGLCNEAVQSCRSQHADVPGYGVIPLTKFASMGSALCFPVEAMVFFTIVAMGVSRARSTPVTRKFLKELVGSVRVYGDDIIVPVDTVREVVDLLEAFGLKVNTAKSFWTGKFRESCGKEYYDGVDVSIVKVRRNPPSSPRDAREVLSYVSTRNQFYKAGWWDVCKFLDDDIQRLIPFPIVEETSQAIGRHSFLPYKEERMCINLHRPLVKAYKVHAPSPPDLLEGEDALLKCLLKHGDEPFADSKHLERSGRPESFNIKLGWVPPY